MNAKTAQLNELIEITRDGQYFYEHAHDEVEDTQLQALFRDMSQAKRQLIQALAMQVAANQETPAAGGTLAGKLRELYADTRAKLSRDQASVYLGQLERVEERILDAFEDALESAEPDVRALLAAQMPKVRACHQQMRSLKLARH